MALLLPLLLPRIALILTALLTMAVVSFIAGYGWCVPSALRVQGGHDTRAKRRCCKEQHVTRRTA